MAERMISRFPKGLSISSSSAKRIYCRADRAILLELCKYLKEELSFEHVSLVTGVDMVDRIQAVYHLTSYTNSLCLIEIVVDLVRSFPERFLGFAGVDPHKGAGAVESLRLNVEKLGLRGAMISPWEHLMFSDDERYYPIYETCVELDIPIWIHTSFNFSRQIPMEYGHPLHLDRVAVRFPELKIVAGHAGWPWVMEMVAVAWRHPNVYIEISGIRQKYMGMEHTGWEPLIHYGNSVLQDKVLFATAWPLLPLEQAVQDVKNLPIKEEVKAKWLGENARRLLQL